MRPGLVLLLIGLPGAALAAEDRYGPSRAQVTPAAVIPASATAVPVRRAPTEEGGRVLSWAGKQAAAPQPVPSRPASSQASISSPAPVQPSRAPEPALPASLYDAPAPAAPAPVAAWSQPVQPVLPPPPSTPPLAGSPTYGYSPPRAYSVVREWGGTPDRIPTPPSASQFSGREVALDPATLGAAQPVDPPAGDEADEEQPQQKIAKQSTKGGRQ